MMLYDVLKASKGLYVNDSFAMLWGKQLGGWKIAELTGTLPMTFRSNGTALIDYRIYGTANGAGVQTENLFGDYEIFRHTNLATRNEWWLYAGNGATQRIECEGNTEYTLSFANVSSIFRVSTSSTNDVPTSNNPVTVQELVFTTNSSSETFTTPNNARFIIVQISVNEQELLNSAMLVKGSTPPETYIPYGYKLPLTITSGEGSKTADLYIGDSKLAAGDYIDYESGKIVRNGTPQDPPKPFPEIDTYIGINTLDSVETLGEVTIKGRIKEA